VAREGSHNIINSGGRNAWSSSILMMKQRHVVSRTSLLIIGSIRDINAYYSLSLIGSDETLFYLCNVHIGCPSKCLFFGWWALRIPSRKSCARKSRKHRWARPTRFLLPANFTKASSSREVVLFVDMECLDYLRGGEYGLESHSANGWCQAWIVPGNLVVSLLQPSLDYAGASIVFFGLSTFLLHHVEHIELQSE
jgi:hypothetical protein